MNYTILEILPGQIKVEYEDKSWALVPIDAGSSLEDIDDAVSKINYFYSRYHSLRYVNGQLVMRLNSGIDPLSVERLNEKFRCILNPNGKIYMSDPLPAEYDEPDLMAKPRLLVDFNNRDFGRLRGLINDINGCKNAN